MSDEAVSLTYEVLLGAGVAACIAFVVAYSVVARWWRSVVGRHLVTFTASLGVLEGTAFVGMVWRDWGWRDELILAALAAIMVATWWQTALLLRAFRTPKPKEPQ